MAHRKHPDKSSTQAYRAEKKPDHGEHIFLVLRNVFVTAAAVLFMLSLLHSLHHIEPTLRGIAYFLGAGAYISELFMLTDCFTIKHPFAEMYMPYVFGVMYIILGISYFAV